MLLLYERFAKIFTIRQNQGPLLRGNRDWTKGECASGRTLSGTEMAREVLKRGGPQTDATKCGKERQI